ncbi:MAG: hypothetical protein ROO73_00830 [Roseivirga sp.]
MYTLHQKSLSIVLLTSLLLQSCGTNLTLDGYAHEMKVDPDEHLDDYSKNRDQSCSNSSEDVVGPAKSPEPAQAIPLTASICLSTSLSTKNSSRLSPRQSQESVATTSSVLPAKQQPRGQVKRPIQPEGKCQTPTLLKRAAKSELNPSTGSAAAIVQSTIFKIADGRSAQFKQAGDQWIVHISDKRFPGCSARATYPVVCEKGKDIVSLLEQVVNQPALQRLCIRIGLSKAVCVIGRQGLRGGMKKTGDEDGYQSEGFSSADEDTKEVRKRLKSNIITTKQQEKIVAVGSNDNRVAQAQQQPVAAPAPTSATAGSGGDEAVAQAQQQQQQPTMPVVTPTPEAAAVGDGDGAAAQQQQQQQQGRNDILRIALLSGVSGGLVAGVVIVAASIFARGRR